MSGRPTFANAEWQNWRSCSQSTFFIEPSGLDSGGRFRPLDPSRRGVTGWLGNRPENGIALECFVQWSALQQVRRSGEPPTHQWSRRVCSWNLGVHEAPIATGAAVGRKSQPAVERFFEMCRRGRLSKPSGSYTADIHENPSYSESQVALITPRYFIHARPWLRDAWLPAKLRLQYLCQ